MIDPYDAERLPPHQGNRRTGGQPASRPFQAAYPGACERCHEAIRPGDLVRYVEDQLVHHHHDPVAEKPVKVCDICHLTLPCECGS